MPSLFSGRCCRYSTTAHTWQAVALALLERGCSLLRGWTGWSTYGTISTVRTRLPIVTRWGSTLTCLIFLLRKFECPASQYTLKGGGSLRRRKGSFQLGYSYESIAAKYPSTSSDNQSSRKDTPGLIVFGRIPRIQKSDYAWFVYFVPCLSTQVGDAPLSSISVQGNVQAGGKLVAVGDINGTVSLLEVGTAVSRKKTRLG